MEELLSLCAAGAVAVGSGCCDFFFFGGYPIGGESCFLNRKVGGGGVILKGLWGWSIPQSSCWVPTAGLGPYFVAVCCCVLLLGACMAALLPPCSAGGHSSLQVCRDAEHQVECRELCWGMLGLVAVCRVSLLCLPPGCPGLDP